MEDDYSKFWSTWVIYNTIYVINLRMKLFFMDSIARSINIILTEKIAYNNHFKAIPEINSSKVML